MFKCRLVSIPYILGIVILSFGSIGCLIAAILVPTHGVDVIKRNEEWYNSERMTLENVTKFEILNNYTVWCPIKCRNIAQPFLNTTHWPICNIDGDNLFPQNKTFPMNSTCRISGCIKQVQVGTHNCGKRPPCPTYRCVESGWTQECNIVKKRRIGAIATLYVSKHAKL